MEKEQNEQEELKGDYKIMGKTNDFEQSQDKEYKAVLLEIMEYIGKEQKVEIKPKELKSEGERMNEQIRKTNDYIDRIDDLETNLAKAYLMLGNIVEEYFSMDDQKTKERLSMGSEKLYNYIEISIDYVDSTKAELKAIKKEICEEVDELKRIKKGGAA